MENEEMKLSVVAIAILFCANLAFAKGADCNSQYAGGTPPEFINQKLAVKTQPLCFDEFAVMHSGLTRTPVWSAEHLTAERVAAGKKIKRIDTFHPEEQLPYEDRAELRDYSRSGWDRGHMAPNKDFGSTDSQAQSFSLANIIPQDPNNNQNLWQGIESSIRTLASKKGNLYVVTGPIYDSGVKVTRLNGRVLVPHSIFKAVYDPSTHQSAAYVSVNAPGMDYQTVSIADLEKRIGINVFPHMSKAIKANKMSLPAPTPHGGGNNRNGGQHDYNNQRTDYGAHSVSPAEAVAKRIAKYLSR
jgi:endonuclease G